VICVLCLCVAAHAQQDRPENRIQVRGVAGWTGFGESIIDHAVVGIATDVRLLAGLRSGLELLYHIGPDRDRDISLLPVLSYDFRRLKRVTPFVSGGMGVLRHTNGGRWSTSFTLGAGGGVKLAVSEHFFVAPEVRVGWEPAVRLMASVGYRY
jgi:hypothetical protein